MESRGRCLWWGSRGQSPLAGFGAEPRPAVASPDCPGSPRAACNPSPDPQPSPMPGHVRIRRPRQSRPRPHQHRQDASRHRADAGPRVRHHRLPAAPAGARELRPHGGPEGRPPRRADHRRGEDRPARARAGSPAPSRRCRWTAPPSSSRWTRSSSAPTPTAATSSPTGCCTRAAWWRPCSSAPRPSARCCTRLVPQAHVETRPRLSQLTYAGPAKLTRLPPRTAVVAFSRRRGLRHRRADPPPPRRLRGGDGPAVARAPATPRWRCTRTGRSISWSPPTRSAWA